VPHVSPFEVAWMLTAMYGVVLLGVAVKIVVLLARTRGDNAGQGKNSNDPIEG
jgi:hypothetical protein